jgi:hypothetical protein
MPVGLAGGSKVRGALGAGSKPSLDDPTQRQLAALVGFSAVVLRACRLILNL